jgi:hypothetical protein
MRDTRLRHRFKNTKALFSYATYTVHGGDVEWCWQAILARLPLPTDTRVGV